MFGTMRGDRLEAGSSSVIDNVEMASSSFKPSASTSPAAQGGKKRKRVSAKFRRLTKERRQANARERQRASALRTAFLSLQTRLPDDLVEELPTRFGTLLGAMLYIDHLDRLRLGENRPALEITTMDAPEPVAQRRERTQSLRSDATSPSHDVNSMSSDSNDDQVSKTPILRIALPQESHDEALFGGKRKRRISDRQEEEEEAPEEHGDEDLAYSQKDTDRPSPSSSTDDALISSLPHHDDFSLETYLKTDMSGLIDDLFLEIPDVTSEPGPLFQWEGQELTDVCVST